MTKGNDSSMYMQERCHQGEAAGRPREEAKWKAVQSPRVVLITPKYPPNPSGYGNQAYAVNEQLLDRIPMWLATPGGGPQPMKEAHHRAGSASPVPKKPGVHERTSWIARTCAWLVRHRYEYDIIHILGGFGWSVPFVLVGKVLRKPTVVKIISREVDNPGHGTLLRRLRIRVLRHATALVVLSEHARNSALGWGFKPEQLRRIPNGVDVHRFQRALEDRARTRAELEISDDCFVVLSVGRIGLRKGVDRLLAAWRAFHPTALGPVRLLVVGAPDGTLAMDEVQSTEDVQVIGHVHDPERFYAAADVLVLLSRSEGMANVLLEAASAGLPSIVSDIPENREVAQSLGALVASGAEDEMAAEAAAHIRSLERAFRMRAQASRNTAGQRIVADEYSLSTVAARYMDLYRELAR